jgi:peptidase U49-like protein
MEREADEAAAEWILEGLDKEDPRFRNRAMGIALALGWLTSTALYVPEDQQYHPPSYERLASIIGRFVPDRIGGSTKRGLPQRLRAGSWRHICCLGGVHGAKLERGCR